MSYRYIFHLKSGRNIILTDSEENQDIEQLIIDLSDNISSPNICRFQTDKDVLLLKADQIEGVLVNTEKSLPKPKLNKSIPKVKKIEVSVSEDILEEDDDSVLSQLVKSTNELLDEEFEKYDVNPEENLEDIYDMDDENLSEDDLLEDPIIKSTNINTKNIIVEKVGNKFNLTPKKR